MHQDVLHRVSTPSMLARRPRYSLVWKLLFVPRHPKPHCGKDETICRPEWGEPTVIGAPRRGAKPPAAKRRRTGDCCGETGF
mmetsp:Transcript_38060/g.91235  ORF Transcript_38060/g.91235 Transcript_38060/m.91235 type:complete len:82 (-) Transcript_38060:14-259(-)